MTDELPYPDRAGAVMHRTASQKMGLKEGARTFFVDAPETARRAIEAPPLDVAPELAGDFDYLHLFTITQAGNHGLVESACLSVDPTWSGLKFTHPKRGKTYRNSYGTLPGS